VEVIWTEEAFNDLNSIYDFLAEKSIQAAQTVSSDIIEKTNLLQNFPESGQKQLSRSTINYRYLITGNYKIIYCVREEHLYINAIFDTRRDPDKLKL
jgi:toxin ParE1/3/4